MSVTSSKSRTRSKSKSKSKRIIRRRLNHWTPAGTLSIDPTAPASKVTVFAFGEGKFVEKEPESLEWLKECLGKYRVLWVNVDGLGSLEVMQTIGSSFGLHKLALEDVLSAHQRPKIDSYGDYHFIILRMLHRKENHRVDTEQLSMFLGEDFVITFQEGVPGDCMESVRVRLREQSLGIRENPPDFLAYSIIDAVIDSYFPILEDLGEQLEELESKILLAPTKELVRQIHDVKRDLLVIRRAVWPLREAIAPLFRDESNIVSEETKIFLRDCYDHTIQVIDLVETYRDLGSSLMDVYLSSLSNKMNEVMKVLTIITTIFVPLTFLAGVYGMNFNTEKSPYNMPELNAYWGYPLCLLAMAILAALELGFFYRRGWIFSREGGLGDLDPVAHRSEDSKRPDGHA